MGKKSYWKSLEKNILRKGEIRAPEWPRNIKSINGGGWSDPMEERRSSCMMKTWGVDGAFLQWAFFRRGVGGQRFLLSQILGGKSGALRIWGSTHKRGVAALVFFFLSRLLASVRQWSLKRSRFFLCLHMGSRRWIRFISLLAVVFLFLVGGSLPLPGWTLGWILWGTCSLSRSFVLNHFRWLCFG